MANDTRKITVEILGKGHLDYKTYSGDNPAQKTMTDTVTEIYKREQIKAKAYENAIEQAKETAQAVAEYSMNRYFTLTEDYMAQDLYRNVKSVASRAKSFGKTLATSATFVATGNIPAAAITFGLHFVNEAFQYRQRMSGYYQALNATNYQTGFSATRAGLVNDSRGTEN